MKVVVNSIAVAIALWAGVTGATGLVTQIPNDFETAGIALFGIGVCSAFIFLEAIPEIALPFGLSLIALGLLNVAAARNGYSIESISLVAGLTLMGIACIMLLLWLIQRTAGLRTKLLSR